MQKLLHENDADEKTKAAIASGQTVYNAPRPLLGSQIWTGEFLTGRFYAAVDDSDEFASEQHKKNAQNGAVIVRLVTDDEIREHGKRLAAEYGMSVDEIDFDTMAFSFWAQESGR